MYEGLDYDVSGVLSSPRDVEWDGSSFWAINDSAGDNAVYKFDSGWGYAFESHDLSSQNLNPRTINYDGQFFLVTGDDTPSSTVFRFDSGWSSVASIDASGQDSDVAGCVKISGSYWVIGATTSTLYEFSPSTLSYTGRSKSLAARPDTGGTPAFTGCTVVNGMIWATISSDDIVFEIDVDAGYTGRWFVTGQNFSGRSGTGWDGGAFFIANRGADRVYSYVPDPPFAEPPTPEDVFRASFADASGRDPLPTALLERLDARKLVGHNVLAYLYPPYIAEVTVPVELDDYPLLVSGSVHWLKDEYDPLFKMGRWALIQGRELMPNPLEMRLTVFISDNPLTFVEPTE